MDPRKLFVDERLLGRCAYCSGAPETRDHVPAKVLLDDPLPENLPVVEACLQCNNEASADEQYLACFIDSVLTGSSRPCEKHREKVRSTLEKRPGLQQLIDAGRHSGPGGELLWTPDWERVESIVVKLARGHVAYEFSETHAEKPEYVWFAPLPTMSEQQIDSFHRTPALQAWPEIGSRAFIRAIIGSAGTSADDGWQVVQEGRYRYTVSCTPALQVKFVLSEYLACEVGW